MKNQGSFLRLQTLSAATILLAGFLASLPAQEKKPDPGTAANPPAPVSYDPTEVETLHLQVRMKDTQLTYQNWQIAIGNYNAEVDAIRKSHKWPDTVQVDPNTLKFFASAKPVTPPTAPPAPPVPPAKEKAK